MNNDVLINQARDLYNRLHLYSIETINDHPDWHRLDTVKQWAFVRYRRRLNKCAVCYLLCSASCQRDQKDTGLRHKCPLMMKVI